MSALSLVTSWKAQPNPFKLRPLYFLSYPTVFKGQNRLRSNLRDRKPAVRTDRHLKGQVPGLTSLSLSSFYQWQAAELRSSSKPTPHRPAGSATPNFPPNILNQPP
jgi:hypothetical protein